MTDDPSAVDSRPEPVDQEPVRDDRARYAPGSADALRLGCSCSLLANAAYRVGQAAYPLVDPGCPLHAPGRNGSDARTRRLAT